MKTENILRRIILVSIFAVPFLAFLVPSSLFFPFITGKNFAFRILVEVMFTAWVILAYYRAEYRPRFSWIMVALTAFVGIIFVADIFGANAYRSLWSNSERMEGFVGLIHQFGYFLVIGSVLSTEKLWTRFFNTVVLTSVIMVFYGFLQMAGKITINQGGVRLDGTFGNASYLAVFMLFSAFFTALLLVRYKGANIVKWMYGTIIFFQLLIIYYTGTRGVMLGLVVGVALSALLILLFVKKNPLVRKIALGAIGGVVLLVGAIGIFRDSSFVQTNTFLSRVASLSLTEALNNPRFMVWGMAIEGVKERPILGWGQENFNLVFNKYYDPSMYSQEQWFDRAHNIFFDWLIAGGILGLLGYLSLFFVTLLLVWRFKGKNDTNNETRLERLKSSFKSYWSGERSEQVVEASIFSGLLVAYFINNIFVFDNLFSYILFFSLLAYLHHFHASGEETPEKTSNAFTKQLPIQYVAMLALVVFVFILWIVNIKPILANQALIEGIRPYGNSFSSKNLTALQASIEYDTFVNSEAREQILQSTLQIKDAPVDAKLKQDMFIFAKDQILLQTQSSPGDARYEMFAGMLFFRYGMNDEAISHLEKAHAFSPNKQTINFNLILAYLNGKKLDQAYSLAKETYELDTNFQEAAKFYAVAAISRGNPGDEQFADELLTKVYGTPFLYDENLINIYASVGKFDRIIATLQKKLNDGDDPQIRLRLAAAYLESGKKTESIATIQQIINAYPDFKQQGEFYINEIRAGKKP